MRGPSVALFSFVLLAGAVIAGCGGGGGGQSTSPLLPGRTANGNTAVQVHLTIPQKTSNGHRRPAYISPNTQSVIVLIVGPAPSNSPSPNPSTSPTVPPILGEGYANFSPQSPNCSTGASGLSCTLNIAANITTAATYGIIIFALDQPQTGTSCFQFTPPPSPFPSPLPSPCAGYVLSDGFAVTPITPGSTTPVNVTLGGWPAYIQPIELVSGMVGGNGISLTTFGPGTSQVSFQLLDADKNIIAGLGATTITATSLMPNVATAAISTPDATGLYTLSITPQTILAGTQNVVSAATTSIQFITSNGPGFLLPLTTMHSVIYVAKSGGQIDAYLDGNNTTPLYTVYGSCASQLGLAVNPNDESLWAADPCNDGVVTWSVGTSGSAPPEGTTFCGTSGSHGGLTCNATSTNFLYPQYLAFDASGDLFMSQGNTGPDIYSIMQWNAPSPGASPNAGLAPNNTYTAGGAYICHIAADNLGHIFAGTAAPSIVSYTLGGGSTVFNSANINGIGWAPDGSLWYLSELASSNSAIKSTPAGVTQTTIAGLPWGTTYPSQSLAVDMLGNVYLANGTGTGVTEYTATSNWVTTQTIGNSASPEFVVVFPDGLYGANHQVGVPQPGQSPYPLGSPPILQ